MQFHIRLEVSSSEDCQLSQQLVAHLAFLSETFFRPDFTCKSFFLGPVWEGYSRTEEGCPRTHGAQRLCRKHGAQRPHRTGAQRARN
eukprot:7389267-Prymnesium_polylepis.1